MKELGAVVRQCDCLAEDMGKIFDVYWKLATPDSQIPAHWPEAYNTMYNDRNPMVVNFNGTNYNTFLSVSKWYEIIEREKGFCWRFLHGVV